MFAFQKDCGLRVIKDLVDGDANLSRIYGFILYTEKDPYVIKVLRDEVFGNLSIAFQVPTGQYLPYDH